MFLFSVNPESITFIVFCLFLFLINTLFLSSVMGIFHVTANEEGLRTNYTRHVQNTFSGGGTN